MWIWLCRTCDTLKSNLHGVLTALRIGRYSLKKYRTEFDNITCLQRYNNVNSCGNVLWRYKFTNIDTMTSCAWMDCK
jgi:hypothetical protein